MSLVVFYLQIGQICHIPYCEVYSSVVGYLIQIMCVYPGEECPLIKWRIILITYQNERYN